MPEKRRRKGRGETGGDSLVDWNLPLYWCVCVCVYVCVLFFFSLGDENKMQRKTLEINFKYIPSGKILYRDFTQPKRKQEEKKRLKLEKSQKKPKKSRAN